MKQQSAPRQPAPAPAAETPWQFRFLIILIGAGVLGLILKTLGLF